MSLRVPPLSIFLLKTLRRVDLVLVSTSATGTFDNSRTVVRVGFFNNSASWALLDSDLKSSGSAIPGFGFHVVNLDHR